MSSLISGLDDSHKVVSKSFQSEVRKWRIFIQVWEPRESPPQEETKSVLSLD